MGATVSSIYLHAVETLPERVFLRWFEEGKIYTESYGESAKRIAWMVGHLESMGIGRETPIIFHTDDLRRSILAFVACAHVGALPVFISQVFSQGFVEKIKEKTCAKAIVSDLEFFTLHKWYTKEDALESLHCHSAARRPDDILNLILTSGSTGEPKLVMRENGINAEACHEIPHLKETPQERFLLISPFSHGQGQVHFCTALGLAAETCIPSEIDVRASLQEIRDLDPTYALFVPRHLAALEKQYVAEEVFFDGEHRMFGPSLKTIRVGGDVPDMDLLRSIRATDGIDIFYRYGSSETETLTYGEHDLDRIADGWLGEVIPGVDIKIAEDGEMLVKSRAMKRGYYRDPELTRAALTEDGYFRTYDYVKLENGQLRFYGRKKDVLHMQDGSWVFPAQIEQVIQRIPYVNQVILVGDHRPSLTAILSVRSGITYSEVWHDLSRINKDLEANQRVMHVVLINERFPEEIIGVMGVKAKKNRALAQIRYVEEQNHQVAG